MSSNKTKETDNSVENFINSVDNGQKRKDSRDLIALMTKITGFSPRKAALTVYIMPGFSGYEKQMAKLGPHKTGKSCLYLRNLKAVDRDVLEEIIRDSVAVMRERYECT